MKTPKTMKKMMPLMVSAMLLAAPALAETPPAAAKDFATDIATIQTGWDKVKYQTPDSKDQLDNLATLETQSQATASAYPQTPEPLIWEGIIYATDAGITGGLGALPKLKKAKALFEKALTLDPKAMNGGAYTSLGSLYYMVPGWPISFGDDVKAENNLKAALAVSPDDIDANYFYGDFLLHKKRYPEAKVTLEKAMKSPARPGRTVADAGRRQEIQQDLNKVDKEYKKTSFN